MSQYGNRTVSIVLEFFSGIVMAIMTSDQIDHLDVHDM